MNVPYVKALAAQVAGLQPVPAVHRVTALLKAGEEDTALHLMLYLNDRYRAGNPWVSDATWDALYDLADARFSQEAWDALNKPGGDAAAAEATGEDGTDDAGSVAVKPLPGAQRLAALREIPLAWYMSSRTKAKPTNKLIDKLLKSARERACDLVVADKLDGIALQLRYLHGKLASVATQGKDGCLGTDVTHVMQHCPNFPKTLPAGVSACIRAEGIFPRAAKAELDRLSGKGVALRNCAGGSIRRLQADARILHLHVVGLQIFGLEAGSYADCLETLEHWGFVTPRWECLAAVDVTPPHLSNRFASARDSLSVYEADGLVVSLDTVPPLEEAPDGNPDAWSLAYKEADLGGMVETVVTEVTWNCTKGGKWAPTIWVEPVVVGGVTVSKVSGVNGFFIEHGYTKGELDDRLKAGEEAPSRLPLGPGARVLLERSGDVVPNIAVVLTGAAEAATPPGAWREAGVEYLVTEEGGDVSIKMLVNQMNHSIKVLGFKGWGLSMLMEVVDGWAQKEDGAGLATWHRFMVECLAAEPEETWRAWLVDLPRKRELVVQQVRQLQALLHNASVEKWLVASGIFQGIAETTAKALVAALEAAHPGDVLSTWSREHELTLAQASGFGPETLALLRAGWPEWIALLDSIDEALEDFAAPDPVMYGGEPVKLAGASPVAAAFSAQANADLLEGKLPLTGVFYLSGVRSAPLVEALTSLGMTEQKSFNARKVDVLLYRSEQDKGVGKKLAVTDPDKAREVAAFLTQHSSLFDPAWVKRLLASLN